MPRESARDGPGEGSGRIEGAARLSAGTPIGTESGYGSSQTHLTHVVVSGNARATEERRSVLRGTGGPDLLQIC